MMNEESAKLLLINGILLSRDNINGVRLSNLV